MKSNISIIVSTYNSPEWLKKVILGFSVQTYKHFELVIADDGSTGETADLIQEFQKQMNFPIVHVWHPDNGFQKTIILNKAIVQTSTDYIIMTDGDCIPRKDFVEVHERLRRPNVFLSGGYHKLPLKLSNLISKDDILSGNCFSIKWLLKNGMKRSFKNNKLNSYHFKSTFLNFITPTNPSWNGHNASAWKKDILAVNGFDERMEYGGEDRELGERLINKGIKGIQIRYSTTCIHLDHARSYINEKALALNAQIRENTKKTKSTWTVFGIKKSKQVC